MLKPILYPYQLRWLKDEARFKIGMFARQTGTTDTGQHVGTANAHERVRDDIEASDTRQLAATLNRDLIRPLIDLNFGPQKHYPSLRIMRDEAKDITALIDNVVKLASIAPNLVEVSVLRDKLGLPEPANGAEVIGANQAPQHADQTVKAAHASNSPKLEEDAVSRIVNEELESWEPMVSPLVAPVQKLAESCSTAEEFLAKLPGVINDQRADELARRLAFAMFSQRVQEKKYA